MFFSTWKNYLIAQWWVAKKYHDQVNICSKHPQSPCGDNRQQGAPAQRQRARRLNSPIAMQAMHDRRRRIGDTQGWSKSGLQSRDW